MAAPLPPTSASPPNLSKPLPDPFSRQDEGDGQGDPASDSYAGKSWDQMQDEWKTQRRISGNAIQAPDRPAPPKPEEASGIAIDTEGTSELTPKSSWESLASESPAPKTAAPPLQSNNPFRRAHSRSNSTTAYSTNTANAAPNTWIDVPVPVTEPIDLFSNINAQDRATSGSFSGLDGNEKEAVTDETKAANGNSHQHDLEGLTLPTAPLAAAQHDPAEPYRRLIQDDTPASFPAGPGTNGRQLPSEQQDERPTSDANGLALSSNAGDVQFPDQDQAPPIPSKISAETSDQTTADASHDIPVATTEMTRSRTGSETYQIRLINWDDASSPVNPRRSPVMLQNANGPCALLALVNALVLSTPHNAASVLIDTLRGREQISLGLLLDAVIEELFSGRRGDTIHNLPDVSELYSFLITLQSGMNANPLLIATDEAANLMDDPIETTTTAYDYRKAGGFEATKEMQLYGVFAIPLVHGWIPAHTHPVYAALKRRATSFDRACDFVLTEADLEAKWERDGTLSTDEQTKLEDIGTIKYFLETNSSQLTGYGLDTISERLAPGAIAVLFRNNHYSTLYRHFRSGQLLTLVTDMGYAQHDEVVWESLVDVTGEGSEFFSGDFSPVGTLANDASPSIKADRRASSTAPKNHSRRSRQSLQSQSPPPQDALPPIQNLSVAGEHPPATEQEDHDLALAMQLQEEEEEENRRRNAQRRRENELSQQYLDNSDSSGRRTFPGFGRGSQMRGGRGGPTVPPRGGSSANRGPNEEPPPPTYEQAAQNPAYHPPTDHPSHPSSSPPGAGSGPAGGTSPTRPRHNRLRGSSAYSEHQALAAMTSSPSVHNMPGSPGPSQRVISNKRRGTMPVSSGPDEKKEKDCVVM